MPIFDLSLGLLAITFVVAGMVRGMTGFGTGLIVAPVAGALYDPVTAVVVLVIVDSLPTLPITLPALKIARWREVLPILAAMVVFVPAGVYVLKNGDETTLRWVICIVILCCTAVLWSGWRYHGRRPLPLSFGVGGLAGLLSGIAAIPGPPVILYWMASPLPVGIVRANLLTLFLLSEPISIVNLWLAGLFDWTRLSIALAMIPIYIVALFAGGRLYGIASEAAYRRVAFTLIVAAALMALPATGMLMDWLFSARQTPS